MSKSYVIHGLPVPYDNMDWKLLRKQKKALLIMQIKALNTITGKEMEAIDGIINLIDAIQDYACDNIGMGERKIFGYR